MTEPGSPSDAPDVDPEALLDAPGASTAAEASIPDVDVPEADALEQQLSARPGPSGRPLQPLGDREADDADLLEQEADVPVDDDEVDG